MRKSICALLSASACLAGVSIPALAQEVVPETYVNITGNGCADGVVQGLNPRGDGFLAVKARPNINSRRVDRIHNGQPVWICEGRGEWLGVVYTNGDGECDMTNPPEGPYYGPCNSGWVSQQWIGWR